MTYAYSLEGVVRQDLGSSFSRRARHDKMIPAVLYGPATKSNMHVLLPRNELSNALRKSSFHTQVIEVKVDGKSHAVVLKDYQQHPCRDDVLHADFYMVDDKQPISLSIPLRFLNQETCKGVKLGGMLQRYTSEVRIMAKPQDLPRSITVDLAKLDVEGWIYLRDLELPKGVSLWEGKSQHGGLRVATVARKRGTKK